MCFITCYICSLGAVADIVLAIKCKAIDDDIMVVCFVQIYVLACTKLCGRIFD